MAGFDYIAFKQKLEQENSFPTVYMFKFIVEADNKKIALVENLFNEDAHITTKESAGGKYFSITSKQVVLNADEIIELYKKAAEIEGLIGL
jgi:putative lipoic acid-binding regulatory protein